MNHVMLIGRLTRDSELAYTAGNYPVLRFSLAVNRRRKSKEGWIEEGHFFDVNLWGKRREGLRPHLLKGKRVAVSGQLRQGRWEKEGQKRSRVMIEASDLQFLN